MADFTIYLGNKNYSSWSLRPWLVLKQVGVAFEESKGDFLFGHFSIADATYAPIVTRLRTYKLELERDAETYCETIMALPAVQEWIAAARNEPMIIDKYEF